MKKYALTNKYLELEYNIISTSYWNTLEEVENAITFMCNEWNQSTYLKRLWTKEDFEIMECE